ncbi:MAG: hypothetical protein WD934_03315, partial [Gemmatimonadales bacterium]
LCQATASFFSQRGDSGAPIFSLHPLPSWIDVDIVGIHVGVYYPEEGGSEATFSEWNLTLMEFFELGNVEYQYVP